MIFSLPALKMYILYFYYNLFVHWDFYKAPQVLNMKHTDFMTKANNCDSLTFRKRKKK